MKEKETKDTEKSEKSEKLIKDTRADQREEIGQIISDEIPQEAEKLKD
jgi:hypothetical protein